MKYVELHARSAFSFLRGAATPEELIAVCAELKMPAMALLDKDGIYGAARFHLAAQKKRIKAHIGAEITIQIPDSISKTQPQIDHLVLGQKRPPSNPNTFALPLLVRN